MYSKSHIYTSLQTFYHIYTSIHLHFFTFTLLYKHLITLCTIDRALETTQQHGLETPGTDITGEFLTRAQQNHALEMSCKRVI